jgi:hypothetical protein
MQADMASWQRKYTTRDKRKEKQPQDRDHPEKKIKIKTGAIKMNRI